MLQSPGDVGDDNDAVNFFGCVLCCHDDVGIRFYLGESDEAATQIVFIQLINDAMAFF